MYPLNEISEICFNKRNKTLGIKTIQGKEQGYFILNNYLNLTYNDCFCIEEYPNEYYEIRDNLECKTEWKFIFIDNIYLDKFHLEIHKNNYKVEEFLVSYIKETLELKSFIIEGVKNV